MESIKLLSVHDLITCEVRWVCIDWSHGINPVKDSWNIIFLNVDILRDQKWARNAPVSERARNGTFITGPYVPVNFYLCIRSN